MVASLDSYLSQFGHVMVRGCTPVSPDSKTMYTCDVRVLDTHNTEVSGRNYFCCSINRIATDFVFLAYEPGKD